MKCDFDEDIQLIIDALDRIIMRDTFEVAVSGATLK